MTKKQKELTDDYIHEKVPKKTYTKKKKIVLRDRRPFELYWSEILITLFIILMMVMLIINYQYQQTHDFEPISKERNQVTVGVGIDEEDMSPPQTLSNIVVRFKFSL